MTDQEQTQDTRPWYKWKTSIGSMLVGLSLSLNSLPDIGVFSINHVRITTHHIGGCFAGLGICIGGVGVASKLQKAAKK